jgi:hypothetical protein
MRPRGAIARARVKKNKNIFCTVARPGNGRCGAFFQLRRASLAHNDSLRSSGLDAYLHGKSRLAALR